MNDILTKMEHRSRENSDSRVRSSYLLQMMLHQVALPPVTLIGSILFPVLSGKGNALPVPIAMAS